MTQLRYHCAAYGCGCVSLVRPYPAHVTLRDLDPAVLREVRDEAERIGGYIKDCDEEPKPCGKIVCLKDNRAANEAHRWRSRRP